MKLFPLFIIFVIVTPELPAQDIDPDLLKIRQYLEEVLEAKARARLELDVDFINMPVKYAELHFQKGKPISYTSENFIVIPRRGLDFTWSELFSHDFMTIDRGMETLESRNLKVLNVIPLDKKADYAIMTLKLDTEKDHIVMAEITTKNEGSFTLSLEYSSGAPFPDQVEVEFELERIRIPLNFMGKDTSIDQEELKSEGLKTGRILLNLAWEYIQ